jgi:hypothetical protein
MAIWEIPIKDFLWDIMEDISSQYDMGALF